MLPETGVPGSIPGQAAPSRAYCAVKRGMDILLCLMGGSVVLLPMLCICVVIMIRDFGNPFYVQRRMGRYGRPFSILKLRTMRKDAERMQELLDAEQLQQYCSEYKLEDDPRLLGWRKKGDGRRCFGAWLRKLSIDELPQIFWNILIRGNMSVVGPRPILQQELEQHYTPEQQKKLLSIKPGLTGYWQVYARNDATYASGERQRMELYYVDHCSVGLDLRILLATVGAVLRKTGT